MEHPAREEVALARAALATSRHVLVLTGAGISTDSGIPDFRGPQGIWTKNPEAEKQSTLAYYLSDPGVRQRRWRSRLESRVLDARPNPGHFAVVELQRQGRLDLVVTQNVDGLHLMAGTDPRRIVEIHGTTREVMCMTCGARTPTPEVLARVERGDTDPACTELTDDGRCGGILKEATISFGQSLVPEDLVRAERAASACDLLLAVGSSLSVYPAAGLVPTAHLSGAKIVIVNAEPTDYDRVADVVLRGPISTVLPRIVAVD